jgi:hypothetical protein
MLGKVVPSSENMLGKVWNNSQNILGKVVKRERPEKKPTNSAIVKIRVKLSATSNL